jgi:signal transduction histidine kinase
MFKKILHSLPLTAKLVMIILFINLAMIPVLFFLYTSLTDDLFKRVEKHTEDLTTAIQVSVWQLATQEYTDTKVLTEYLNALKAEGIGEISIINTDLEIIASTNPEKVGNIFYPVKKSMEEEADSAQEQEPCCEKPYNIFFPVMVGDELFGYIHLKMRLDDIDNILRQNYVERLYATFIVFSFGILAAIYLARRYTKPIHQVVSAVKRVAAGDLSQTIHSDRLDEIGELTKNFNEMIVELRVQKELKERLARAEHLSKIGQLASGIAHEIKNPLNLISLSIDHMKEKYAPQTDPHKKRFEALILNIKDEIHRLKKLIDDFLNYGKPLVLCKQSFDVVQLLSQTISLVAVKAQEQGIEIEKRGLSEQQIFADPELIKTCFLNVILNAFQAMPEEGRVIIDVQQVCPKTLRIQFTDNGPGISEEALARVFEPYFTTKDVGIGLGLFITKRIIEQHHGAIRLMQAEQQSGTIAEITLPIITEHEASHEEQLSSCAEIT